MTCTHRFDVDDMCIDCGYDDGLRYMQPTQAVLRLADLPRPAGEQHDMNPAHDLCLGDDPCICIQLVACEQRVANEIWGAIREGSQYKSGFEGGLDAAREAVDSMVIETAGNSAATVNQAVAAIDALREKT